MTPRERHVFNEVVKFGYYTYIPINISIVVGMFVGCMICALMASVWAFCVVITGGVAGLLINGYVLITWYNNRYKDIPLHTLPIGDAEAIKRSLADLARRGE